MNREEKSAAARYGAAFFATLISYAVVFRSHLAARLGPLRNLAASLAGSTALSALPLLEPRLRPERRRALLWVLLSAAALRLASTGPLPLGSDDAYRYLWDGRVQAHGINPYRDPPQDPKLHALADPTFYPHIFRPDMRTVYPPVAQLWFLGAYALHSESFCGLQALLLLNELVALLLLWLLLERLKLPRLRTLYYAWSPLAITQTAAALHLDALMIPWLLAALLLAEQRPASAGGCLAVATMVRPLAALCLPALLLRRPLRQGTAALGGFSLGCALLVLPYISAGFSMIESLLSYGEHWRFNGSLFRLAELLFSDSSRLRPTLYATIALGSIGIGALRYSRQTRFALALGLYFALAPTIYPWYLVPLSALLAIDGGPLAIVLAPAVMLSDLVLVEGIVGGRWEVPTSALLIEYGVLYSATLWQLLKAQRQRRR